MTTVPSISTIMVAGQLSDCSNQPGSGCAAVSCTFATKPSWLACSVQGGAESGAAMAISAAAPDGELSTGMPVLCKSFGPGPDGPCSAADNNGAAGRVARSRQERLPELVPCPSLSSRLWLELIDYLEQAQEVNRLTAADSAGQPCESLHAMEERAARSREGASECDRSWSLQELAAEIQCEGHAFARVLFEFMHSRDISPVNCYRSADIDRRHFSRLKNSTAHPSRAVILRFALALKLSLEETNHLLSTEGFALSDSIPEDRAIAYFIRKGIWSRFVINEALFALELNLI